MPESRKFQSRRGFTIMEVALASTVLALTLVGMIGVVETGSQMLDLSRKQTIAEQVLHSEIDQLRLQTWTVIAGEPGASSNFYGPTQVGFTGSPGFLSTPGNGYPASTILTAANDPSFATFVLHFPNFANLFSLTRTVGCVQPAQANQNPTAYSSYPKILQVTFTITWKGITGRKYTRVSTTYVGYNGLYQSYQRS